MAGFPGGYPYKGVAPALTKLRSQLDAAAPRRSKLSDGFLGDPKHANSISFHNPHPVTGLVFAGDFTHDPANGVDCNELVADLIESRDPRLLEIIWNRRYWTPERGWVPYRGVNPHDKHCHITVRNASKLYNSTADWRLPIKRAAAQRPATPAAPPAAPLPHQEIDVDQFALYSAPGSIIVFLGGPGVWKATPSAEWIATAKRCNPGLREVRLPDQAHLNWQATFCLDDLSGKNNIRA